MKMQNTYRKAILLVGLVSACFMFTNFTSPDKKLPELSAAVASENIYEQLNLHELGLNENTFHIAMNGLKKLEAQGEVTKKIISICDFSQSSNNRRLYVIDVANRKLLFNCLVAHGKNSGEEFARHFSNVPESYKSSLGFYTTKETYMGAHGLSLKLAGKEAGFNDMAEARAIVLHGADYVCDDFICRNGRLGRSFGCPSVPNDLLEPIINTIKGGTCLFIYYPDKNYLSSSELIK